MKLLAPYKELVTKEFTSSWRSPSNIALVKYWGKKGHQLPANPSLSMSLKNCFTTTKTIFRPASELSVELKLEGKLEPKFAQKIKNYLENLSAELPWLKRLEVKIETSNTFPHGAGIASSASGLSAFALCLTDYLYHLSSKSKDQNFFKEASNLSRLASGSACRSVYGGFTTWGDESDEFASPIEVHPDLKHLYDAVVVVSGEEKSVSSRAGHERMKEHAFAEARFIQAKNNFARLKAALMAGDINEVGLITENEALSLHAMMMTSPEAFTLFRPESIMVMEKVRVFRQKSHLPVYFTLDAGPNVHLIYPPTCKKEIETFIKSLEMNVIFDETGEGPKPC